MQLYYFSNPIRSFLKIFILIFLSGCGSYQYSSIMTDDIYETNQVSNDNGVENSIQNIETKKSQNLYYKNAFSEKSKEYELISNENDILFTDAEQYSSSEVESDSLDFEYGPWGDNKTSITINMLGGHSYNSIHGSWRNYPTWLWNSGYGYGHVFGYGMNTWGYGYDMFWAVPFHNNLHHALFFPFWNNLGWHGYGYGYGYGYGGWPGHWYSGNSYYNNIYTANNSIAYISGRRSSSNLSNRSNFSSRISQENYFNQSRISDKMINSSLRDKTSRIETLNQSVRVKPNYNKPYNNSTSKWVPANSKNRYNKKTKPSYNNTNPSYNNSKPSYNSSNNNSRPSYNSSNTSRSGRSSNSSIKGRGGLN